MGATRLKKKSGLSWFESLPMMELRLPPTMHLIPDTQPSNTGRLQKVTPLLSSTVNLYWQYNSGNNLVWSLTGDLGNMGRPLSLSKEEQGPKSPLASFPKS